VFDDERRDAPESPIAAEPAPSQDGPERPAPDTLAPPLPGPRPDPDWN